MKKITMFALSASLVALSGCTTTPNNNNTIDTINTGVGISRVVFQTAVNNKCLTEIDKNSVWNGAKVVLSPSQQQQVTYDVCNCVSTKAFETVTAEQKIAALISAKSREALVVSAVTNSLSSCYGEVTKTLTK